MTAVGFHEVLVIVLVYIMGIMPVDRLTIVTEVVMTYSEFITKNHLWNEYRKYRSLHRKISSKRALRAFACKYGYVLNRRQHEANVQNMIKIAKVNLYEMY